MLKRTVIISTIILTISSSKLWSMDIHSIEKQLNELSFMPILKRAKSDLNTLQERYEKLNELSLKLNQYTPKFHQTVVGDLDNGRALYGKQLTILHKIVSSFVILNYQFGKIFEMSENKILKLLVKLDQVNSFRVNYSPFYHHKRFRRLVNAPDMSYDIERKELKKYIEKLIKKSNIKEIRSLLKSFRKDIAEGNINRNEQYVSQIKNHHAHSLLEDEDFFKKARNNQFGQTASDYANNMRTYVLHHLSGAFGNIAGSIQWRKGHLLNKKKIISEIYQNLKPLDIITEKSSFILTDNFIPGHFGHNAIWLGTKDQLIDIGLWDHPVIKPHQEAIASGKSLIESDRSGTHLKSLEKFMNIDELAILRVKKQFLDNRPIADIYKVALLQLGKKYDFNFDVETTDKLVCSELLYQSFGNINWPTYKYVGRITISPDNVASLALYDDTPVELVYYVSNNGLITSYHDLNRLAKKMDFVKKNGSYKKITKICTHKVVEYPYSNMRTCRKEWEDLIYTPHRPIPDFPLPLKRK